MNPLTQMNALILKPEYAEKIARGEKLNEFRNYSTAKINEEIAIISGNSVYAYAKITKVIKLENHDFKYAWNLKILRTFPLPESRPRCERKLGQQIWASI